MPERNLTGERFNLLRVVALVDEPGPETWLCQCVCGSYRKFPASQLFCSGGAYSCGCYQRAIHEESRAFDQRAGTTMAAIFPVEFRCWQKLNAKGRLCRRWTDNFTQFMRDMGPRTDAGIHRANSQRQYGPGNAGWGREVKAEPHTVRWNGETVKLVEFTREAGIQRRWIRRTWPGQTELDGHEIVREHEKMLARRKARQNRQKRNREVERKAAREQAAPYNAPFTPQFLR